MSSDDSLPAIYKEVTGKDFEDGAIVKNRYYGREEWDLISEICSERYPGYTLLPALVGSLLDTESRNSVLGVRRNAVKSLEAEIRHSFYRDERDAEEMLRAPARNGRGSRMTRRRQRTRLSARLLQRPFLPGRPADAF